MATSWAPAPADVAARLPARLHGLEAFTDSTIPTEAQALEVIEQAVKDIVGAVGSFDPTAVINPADVARGEDPVTLGDLATNAAELDAAAAIELGFFPEQIAEGSYEQLVERYRLALSRLEQAVVEYRAGGIVAGRGIPQPKYSFPDPEWPTAPRLPE